MNKDKRASVSKVLPNAELNGFIFRFFLVQLHAWMGLLY